jgi:hypothetical protein
MIHTTVISLLALWGGVDGRSGAPAVAHLDRAPAATVLALAATRRRPITGVLGVRIGMGEAQAHFRLASLGFKREIENEESEAEGREAVEGELWTLKSSHFRYIVVGIESGRVVSLQAFARPGHRTLRYADIGDMEQAKRLGFYIYEWTVAGRDGAPAVCIEARGVDPEFLGSYSIVRDRTRAGAPESPRDADQADARRDAEP